MSVESYIEKRKDYEYYKYLRSLLKVICRPEDTICDVGSGGIDMLSDLPCKKKISIDIRNPISNDEVEGIKDDYLSYEIKDADIITCFQVLEHVDDDNVGVFAKKLIKEGRIVVISVPYMWEEGKCKWHVQDPVDVEKIISWFGKNPVFLQTVTEKNKFARIIAIFLRDYNPEIDLEYWRKDAERTLASYRRIQLEREQKRNRKQKISLLKSVFRFKREKSLYSQSLPRTIRIDASTVCQLRCSGCFFQKNEGGELGHGYLSLEQFVDFIDKNPQIQRVELSNYGEIFLNPALIDIMAYAHKKGVELEASMGVNFNTVSDEQMQALVDYEFRFISFSIDGASQDSYSKYRIGGDFDRVISNVKKLQKLKEEHGAVYPKLQWQFVPNEYNENEVVQAKAMAEELGIPIVFKLNYLKSYKPKNPERLKAETGLTEASRQEYLKKYKIPYLNDDCLQVFNDPQFNWDGTLLGCSRNEWRFFESNLFRDGLANCLKDKDYIRMKKFLLSKNPNPENFKRIPCLKCEIWKGRHAYKKALKLKKND